MAVASNPSTVTEAEPRLSGDGRGHRHPMIPMGIHRTAAQSPHSRHRQVVAVDLAFCPQHVEHLHDADNPVDFLHPKLGNPLEHCDPVGCRRGHRQYGHLVDAARQLFSTHPGGFELAGASPDVARFPVDGDVGSHAGQHVDEPAPGWAEVHVFNREVAAGGYARTYQPEGGLGGVAGYTY